MGVRGITPDVANEQVAICLVLQLPKQNKTKVWAG